MVSRFKEKVPAIQAIEFTSALTQSPDVANMIGATAFSVSMPAKRTVFTVGEDTYTVQEGQIVCLISNVVTVMDAAEFYPKYEAI